VVGETADVAAVGETEMIADPKRKPHQDEGDGDKAMKYLPMRLLLGFSAFNGILRA
jgi:hypothetical protein